MYDIAVKDNLVAAPGEEVFEITLKNRLTGTTYPRVFVYGKNTLGEVLKEYADDLGVNANDSKIIFQNPHTGRSTCDKKETIAGIGLLSKGQLDIIDNAGVAGVS